MTTFSMNIFCCQFFKTGHFYSHLGADAHGVPMVDVGDGMKQFKFMRAFYGISVSAAIGIGVTFLSTPEPESRQKGLVWGTIKDAIIQYKGSPGEENASKKSTAIPQVMDRHPVTTGTRESPIG